MRKFSFHSRGCSCLCFDNPLLDCYRFWNVNFELGQNMFVVSTIGFWNQINWMKHIIKFGSSLNWDNGISIQLVGWLYHKSRHAIEYMLNINSRIIWNVTLDFF